MGRHGQNSASTREMERQGCWKRDGGTVAETPEENPAGSPMRYLQSTAPMPMDGDAPVLNTSKAHQK